MNYNLVALIMDGYTEVAWDYCLENNICLPSADLIASRNTVSSYSSNHNLWAQEICYTRISKSWGTLVTSNDRHTSFSGRRVSHFSHSSDYDR